MATTTTESKYADAAEEFNKLAQAIGVTGVPATVRDVRRSFHLTDIACAVDVLRSMADALAAGLALYDGAKDADTEAA